MVRLTGAAAVLLIAVAPALVVPNPFVLATGVLAAIIGFSGVLLPSLGLATVGAICALLVFSAALLMAPTGNAWLAATLMGIAVVVMLDAAHYQQRFFRSAIGEGVAGRHLTDLAVTVLAAVLLAAVLALLLAAISAGVDATLRPFIAAAGGILVVLAILRRVTFGSEDDA